jgi:hypothetical protein
MPRRSQEKLLGLCLVLLAAGGVACGEGEPAPAQTTAQKEELPTWADCKNWRRRDGSCDPAALLADYQHCLGTEGIPTKQRLLEHQVRSTAVARAWERATIVCLEKRRWMMKPEAMQYLPGRSPPPPSPPPS